MKIIDVILAAGPVSDAIVQISSDDTGTVFLQTQNNGFLLNISGNRIVFEAVVDTAIPSSRDRILAALLTYNAVWQDTGSIRMALTGSGPDAYAILIADMLMDDTFTAENIAAFVEDLDAKIEIWRDIISNGADDGADVLAAEHSVRV